MLLHLAKGEKWVQSEVCLMIETRACVVGDTSLIHRHVPLNGSGLTLPSNHHRFSSRDALRNELSPSIMQRAHSNTAVCGADGSRKRFLLFLSPNLRQKIPTVSAFLHTTFCATTLKYCGRIDTEATNFGACSSHGQYVSLITISFSSFVLCSCV